MAFVPGEFPAQRASNAENISFSGTQVFTCYSYSVAVLALQRKWTARL